MSELSNRLLGASQLLASAATAQVASVPGYYSIWIDAADELPAPFRDRLIAESTTLIYVGIATQSLRKRLVDQDLHGKSHSSFFRSIGAVLGYRPDPGSLIGKANQDNYKFSKSNRAAIVSWISSHLMLRIVPDLGANKSTETLAIRELRPLLNIKDNPRPMFELLALRELCKGIARGCT